MIVRDELNRHLSISSDEIIMMLKNIKIIKVQEVNEIKSKINKYEDKRRAEEAFYQSLSPLRKFFASRPPSHHQAVEYIVHVKERLKQIDIIKQRIYKLDQVIEWCDERSFEKEIELSSIIIEEIMKYRKVED
jgi:acetyl-CoA carboxylase alpha subunit